MRASIKKNFAYSAVLTVSGYLFPLITFPYVTRVLGVNNIGICNFVLGTIGYFIIVANLGMMTVAIRETAAAAGNREKLSKVFSSLLALHLISTLAAMAVLAVCIFLVPRFYEHRELLWIGTGQIFFNFLTIEWLYKGIENFRYITVRSVAVRLVQVVLTFVVVRQPDDYVNYFLLQFITVVINALINIVYSRNFVSFSFKDINVRPYLKSFLILGLYSILTSMYTTFNTMYLGIVSNNVEVAYYSVATKLYTIILALFTAFTGVMLPRNSALIAEGKIAEFRAMFVKSFKFLLVFAVPLIILTEFFAPLIIRVIAGPSYEGAILPMRLVMPLVFVIGAEQILVIQTLMPLKKDKAILFNSVIGAILGIVLNIMLVPRLFSVGSALVWIICELISLVLSAAFVRRYAGISFFEIFRKKC
ncbi:MAG: flippase [Bacteroidales bacterium]|nr:flippase [Bacteroidales bacterium]